MQVHSQCSRCLTKFCSELKPIRNNNMPFKIYFYRYPTIIKLQVLYKNNFCEKRSFVKIVKTFYKIDKILSPI